MQLSGLTELLSRLAPIAALRDRDGDSRVFGVLNAAKPAVLAAVAENRDNLFLVVTPHPLAARDLASEITHWSTRPVACFPAIESLPYERVRLDRAVLAEREEVVRAVASGDAGIVVVPIRALLQPIGGAQRAIEPLILSVGDQILPDRLVNHFLDAGYVESAVVDEVGTFARRGGLVDVFPAGSERPVRVEFFGNEVDSLRTFDPFTQRSVDAIEKLTVPAIASYDAEARSAAIEALLAVDTSTMNAEAETRWLDDIARLESDGSLDDLSVVSPYLIPDTSLVDLLPSDATLIVDLASETWETMHSLWEQAVERQRGLEESGDLPRDLKPALISPDSLNAGLENLRRVELVPGSSAESGDADWAGLFAAARPYAGRLRDFVRDIQRNRVDRTIISSHQPERVAELLAEDDIVAAQMSRLAGPPMQGVTVLPVSLAEGWILPSESISVLTDHELFGKARIQPVRRKTRPARETFFAAYSPGDYVVHLEHGIGRFDSVTRMEVDGTEREYAMVQFAGTDRVYVPTDQLERLTKYVGVGDAAPQLSRLGGGEWQRARQRAKLAAADIARELIDLYSKRMARPGLAFGPDLPWQAELESSFAYPETPDQLRAIQDVKSDMELARPMDRLVCADVGYGKTEVAVRAAFKAVMSGRQVAVLAPTTILAQQHFETFSDRFAAFPLNVEVLSRFRTAAEQRDILRRVASGEVDVLIGTHRILQKDVAFKNLGLLIIDEEQRFGVRHKEQLKKLRETIDVLTLTATPIPRTLHMTMVGIREVSVIETAPEGRLPIKTYLQPYDDRLIREALLRELDRDGQVYMVHNKVATIEAMAERVRRLVPEARVIVAHGQMDETQLERAMLSFAHHEADVLVSSTIIENGLDIPNVNTIVMNNAHTLGLTQMYQLRGRVGRSANQAYAYLLYPRDVRLSHDSARRMEAVFEARELGAGFSVAMKDLEIRGAGNLLGADQSGNATAIGFDLYTRMISDAVERLRGVHVEEPVAVTIDVPLTMYLPHDYVSNESERLTLYRRLSAVTSRNELESLEDEMRDRFGPLPQEVRNLVSSVELKLLAIAARATSVVVNQDHLIMRIQPTGLYDRVSLYRKYGTDARISANMLRIPRRLVGADWASDVRSILHDMIRLRESVAQSEPVQAASASTTSS